MAKEWAESFYLSKSWIHTREAYMVSQQRICERCGEPAKICHHRKWLTKNNIQDPYITLGWRNLEALCQDCHNKEHHRKEKVKRYRFSKDGSVLPPC